MSNKMDTIWSKLDRKSTAIAEFTMRQYRTRVSTWVVMIASAVAIFLMLLFYIEAMNSEIEAIDNDGDSFDSDGDGYPCLLYTSDAARRSTLCRSRWSPYH